MNLTETEKIILENTDERCEYIARDENGDLYVYTMKPKKRPRLWDCGEGECETLRAFNHLFKDIKWEDKEPLQFRNDKGECLL